MRIVIDLQGAQTESRFRGIGRYSLSLAKAMAQNSGDHEIIIALNGLFPHTIEPIRAEFSGLLPQENIQVWHTPGPVLGERGYTGRAKAAELIREAFLESLQPDIIHIMNMFEGYLDNAVASINRFDSTTPVSVTLHDLIPLMNPETYLKPNPVYEEFYHRKIDYLRSASMVIAISESSRQEGMTHLELPGESIVNTSEAADNCFQPLSLSADQVQAIHEKFSLTGQFVLYCGGADERKNLPRLVRAYAMLDPELRKDRQLVLAGRMPDTKIHHLRVEAEAAGLQPEELVFTGYVTDHELVELYNLCKLYVFPSWHEGFGLPALEAMSCGAPVLAANNSSLPEVIGREDALFDPFSVNAIAAKMAETLSDEAFMEDLARHGTEQASKFSWQESARRVIAAFEQFHNERPPKQPVSLPAVKPRLAYVSPLPPLRTGIADYSAELLPELSRYYDIEVIVNQEEVAEPLIEDWLPTRTALWFTENADRFDRIIYHFGNSTFHLYMFELLERFPGVVVLHDFFLGGIQERREYYGLHPNVWVQELYHTFGYMTVQERFENQDAAALKYPSNLTILQQAQGVIVHSSFARQLVNQFYGQKLADSLAVIPHLRVPASPVDSTAARQSLGFDKKDFIICSFGHLGSIKMNQHLLDAWLNSGLAKDKRCQLVFVGENTSEVYCVQLLEKIEQSGLADRIRITGWADEETFHNYLAVADIGVQLRTQSRGETSGTVLDCMNYGLPTIVNAAGSMAELPPDAVWMMAEEFETSDLSKAIETIWKDKKRRKSLGNKARETIMAHHDPAPCAAQYAEAIEGFFARPLDGRAALINSLANLDGYHPDEPELVSLARTISDNFPVRAPQQRNLYIDVSIISQDDYKTGIQRVIRCLTLELFRNPPEGYRIEPVYLSDVGGRWHYRYAHKYTLELLNCKPDLLLEDEVLETFPGDILLGLDLAGEMVVQSAKQEVYQRIKNTGTSLYFVVYDLLPVLRPQGFPPGMDEGHDRWLRTIAQYDGALCISKSVADELQEWLTVNVRELERFKPFKIGWFHLGADVENSMPTNGLPAEAPNVLARLAEAPSFIMVGTVEPRKGHAQVLAGMEQLWADGIEANLVIVGKEGWMVEELVGKMHNHPEMGKSLFWLQGISDEYLQKLYAASTCLVLASEGEGFGLPLIEAAQHQLPIITRDLPVFREVAGEHALYFSTTEPSAFANTAKQWLKLFKNNRHPKSASMPWLTWEQSTRQLLDIIMKNQWQDRWMPAKPEST